MILLPFYAMVLAPFLAFLRWSRLHRHDRIMLGDPMLNASELMTDSNRELLEKITYVKYGKYEIPMRVREARLWFAMDRNSKRLHVRNLIEKGIIRE